MQAGVKFECRYPARLQLLEGLTPQLCDRQRERGDKPFTTMVLANNVCLLAPVSAGPTCVSKFPVKRTGRPRGLDESPDAESSECFC